MAFQHCLRQSNIGHQRTPSHRVAESPLPLAIQRTCFCSPRSVALRHQQQQASLPSRSLQVTVRATPQQPAETAKEGYDVYLNEPRPLKEGESKHVISVFVADEAGLINRVAGVFGRRGANIESLAVGLTVDKALFTIVVTGTDNTVANLVKQLGKLVKVRYVEDITDARRVERELMLIKVGSPAGPARTEVMQLAEIFRARIVDVSERYLTLAVSGDPGKILAMQKVMTKFGIVEIARTGRVSLKRGEELLEEGSGAVPITAESRDADVYIVDDDEQDEGVWTVTNILEAPTYLDDTAGSIRPHTLSIDVTDVPGVLNQVTGVFARRGYNVQSLAVGPSEQEGRSRITMVVPGTDIGIQNLIKQVKKLVSVLELNVLTDTPFVARELMLVKVRCSNSARGELRDLVEIFRGTVVDVSTGTITTELVGKEDKMKAFCELLEPYGILEIARTGRVSLLRESGVDSAFLEKRTSARVF